MNNQCRFRYINKFRTLSFLLLNVLLLIEVAQAQNFVFAKVPGNTDGVGGNVTSRAITKDNAGNTYVTGYFTATADFDPGSGKANLTSAGGNDIFIAKFDAAGNYVYARALGGLMEDLANDIAVDGSGNVYITGTFSGTADFDPGTVTTNLVSAGSNDIFFARYNPSGNYVYAKRVGGTNADAGNSIALDASGNAFITGYFVGTADFNPGSGIVNLTSAGGNDVFVASYDPSGNYTYAKQMGGTSGDVGNSIAVDNTGKVYITGSFSLMGDFDPGAGVLMLSSAGGNDIFLSGLDASGNFLYAKSVGGTSGDIGNSLHVDGAGNAFVTGSFSGNADFDPGSNVAVLTSTGNTDAFVARFDASGNYVFAIGLGGTDADAGYGVITDASNNSYVTGTFGGSADFDPGTGTSILTSAGNSDIFVAAYDPDGNYIFAKSAGGAESETANGIAIDAAGECYVIGTFQGTGDFDPGTGTFNLSIGNSLVNSFLLTLNSTGLYVRAVQLGSYLNVALNDNGKSIAVDALGNTYIIGTFDGTVDFDPGAGTANLTSAGNYDIFIAKYDPLGNYVYARGFGSTNQDAGESIAVDASGNVYVTGAFFGTIDFDPGPGIANLSSVGSRDIFIARYDVLGNYVYAVSMGSSNADVGYGIAVDGTGNAYVTGYFVGTVDFDPGTNTANLTSASGTDDIFFAKYDASGNYVYAKRVGGGSGDFGRGIAVDLSGHVYLTGYFNLTVDFDPGAGTVNLSSAGVMDIFIASYDASGNYVYAKRLGGTSTEYAYKIAIDASNNVYITGSFNGNPDFDPGPGTVILTPAGSQDMFIAAYDPQGNYIYAKSIGGVGNESGDDIRSDMAGNIYITGWFSGTADFDPDAGVANITSSGNSDIFIAKYDASGNYIYAKGVGSTGREQGTGIAVDATGNTYITGFIAGTTDFDPARTAVNSIFTSSNAEDFFLAKYGPLSALPIELTSFFAQPVTGKNAVTVTWITASEKNNHYFEVERSRDGLHYEAVTRIAGCSTCLTVQNYKYDDLTPYGGKSYYRLKQVDYDHKSNYSQIVTVNTVGNLKLDVQAYPTITNDAFEVKISNRQSARSFVIQLVNSEGRLLQEQAIWLNTGNNLLPYSLVNKSAGVYYVRVIDRSNSSIATVMIIKT